MPAPIALFVYNRPSHTRRTLDALRRNALAKDSELIVYSDGPKQSQDEQKIADLRSYVSCLSGFKRVYLINREENFGLSKSIIMGVTETVTRHGRLIVLEDDIVTSPYFLRYMNEALDLYENEGKVISIAAYMYPVSEALPSTFFLPMADCWGWATWKRGWELFESNGQKLFDELVAKRLLRQFDLDGAYPYVRMLRKQIAGENDSWAIRWYASAFIKEKLTLYPNASLVQNIGNDGGGTHSRKTDVYNVDLASQPIRLQRMELKENETAAQAVRNYLRRTRRTLPALLRLALNRMFS